MKRYAFYIAVLLLTFCFSAVVTKIYFVWNVQFWEFGRGSFATCGDLANGFKGGGGFISYQSYDGVKLSYGYAYFDSAATAKQCFQSDLERAVKIVEQGKLDDGTTERVVAVFPPNEYTDTEWAQILFLGEDQIVTITSPSLRHALIFEQQKHRNAEY